MTLRYRAADARVRAAHVASDEVVHGLDGTNALYESQRCVRAATASRATTAMDLPGQAVIKLGPGKRFEADLDYCKGCGLCVSQCPCNAIKMIPEMI